MRTVIALTHEVFAKCGCALRRRMKFPLNADKHCADA